MISAKYFYTFKHWLDTVSGLMAAKDWIDIAVRFITLAGTLFAVRWAVKLAVQRYKAEKQWELQSQTYIRALESLAIIKHLYAVSYDEQTQPSEYLGATDKLREASASALLDLEKIAAVGPYFLSQTAIDALNKVVSGRYDTLDGPLHEYFDGMYKRAKSALEIVRGEAETIHRKTRL